MPLPACNLLQFRSLRFSSASAPTLSLSLLSNSNRSVRIFSALHSFQVCFVPTRSHGANWRSRLRASVLKSGSLLWWLRNLSRNSLQWVYYIFVICGISSIRISWNLRLDLSDASIIRGLINCSCFVSYLELYIVLVHFSLYITRKIFHFI